MNFEKPGKTEFWNNEKKLLEISSFYTCVPKTEIIWATVSEIRNQTFFLQQESNRDCHFRPFFALLPHYWPRKLKFGKNVNNTWRYYPFTHLHHKSRSHDVWFQRYKAQNTEFLSFWATFCPFTPLTTHKIKILKKWKKTTRDIIILYMSTIKKSWCIIPEIWSVTDKIFFLVLDHFLPFYPSPLNNPINCNRQIFLSSWAIACPSTP